MPEDRSHSDGWSLSDDAEDQMEFFDQFEEPPEP